MTVVEKHAKCIGETALPSCAAKGIVEERILSPIRNLDSAQDSNVGTLEILQKTIGPHWRRRCRQMLAVLGVLSDTRGGGQGQGRLYRLLLRAGEEYLQIPPSRGAYTDYYFQPAG